MHLEEPPPSPGLGIISMIVDGLVIAALQPAGDQPAWHARRRACASLWSTICRRLGDTERAFLVLTQHIDVAQRGMPVDLTGLDPAVRAAFAIAGDDLLALSAVRLRAYVAACAPGVPPALAAWAQAQMVLDLAADERIMLEGDGAETAAARAIYAYMAAARWADVSPVDASDTWDWANALLRAECSNDQMFDELGAVLIAGVRAMDN